MKTPVSLLFVFLIFTGCSLSKMIPSQWVSEDFKNQKFDRMLVFANTQDTNLQIEFENKMAVALAKNGIVSLTMHSIFPEIEYKEDYSQEAIDQFILNCNKRNIDKVLVASQKSVSVDTLVARTLHNYFNSLESLKLGSTDGERLVYDKKEMTTCTLEATVYDIDMASKDTPIATTTLKVINPKSLEKLKEHFLIAITQLFENR